MNIANLFQQAQKMRDEAQRIQDQLATRYVEAITGGGMVKVTANGKQQITRIEIDPQVLSDRKMTEDLVMAGVNEALRLAQEMAREEMSKLMGGLGPLANLFKGS